MTAFRAFSVYQQLWQLSLGVWRQGHIMPDQSHPLLDGRYRRILSISVAIWPFVAEGLLRLAYDDRGDDAFGLPIRLVAWFILAVAVVARVRPVLILGSFFLVGRGLWHFAPRGNGAISFPLIMACIGVGFLLAGAGMLPLAFGEVKAQEETS